MTTNRKPLTGKQEKFCQGIADGLSQADAYRAAYSTESMKPDVVYVRASELMAAGKISVRVAELRKQTERKSQWTREKSVRALVEAFRIARDQGQSSAMTGAVKELNAMHGFNEPVRVDHLSSDGSMSPPTVIELVAGEA